MAMLLRFANLGEQAVRACRAAFDPDDGDAPRPADDHPILAGLETWIRDGAASLPAPPDPGTDRIGLQKASQARLFWEAVERLVEWRDTGRVGRTGGAGGAEEVLIDHLAAAVDGLDPRLQAGVGKLRDTLVSLTGLADATAGELFERYDTPLAHAMTLFLLRHDCVDLFDYDSDRLAEPDRLAAAVLFGVRDGWMKLPLRLRASRALSDAVSHRMARMSHRMAGTGLDLGRAPARVRPLRELFGAVEEQGGGAVDRPPPARAVRRRLELAVPREVRGAGACQGAEMGLLRPYPDQPRPRRIHTYRQGGLDVHRPARRARDFP